MSSSQIPGTSVIGVMPVIRVDCPSMSLSKTASCGPMNIRRLVSMTSCVGVGKTGPNGVLHAVAKESSPVSLSRMTSATSLVSMSAPSTKARTAVLLCPCSVTLGVKVAGPREIRSEPVLALMTLMYSLAVKRVFCPMRCKSYMGSMNSKQGPSLATYRMVRMCLRLAYWLAPSLSASRISVPLNGANWKVPGPLYPVLSHRPSLTRICWPGPKVRLLVMRMMNVIKPAKAPQHEQPKQIFWPLTDRPQNSSS
mmetsp:Transcript_100881/g.308429  ORF Transcript_100881/g.308429 Transcript_100881/m.308429 type:complete len:253 (-) Transcript_100881:34-792(-)